MPPRFSIIIPVLHEQAVITATIANLGELLCREDSDGEIIVVDGDAEGNTIETLAGTGVKTTVGIKGRGNQMNRGAALAEGDILLFLHADTRLPPGAFGLMETALQNTGCRAGAFDLAIASDRPVFRMIAGIASIRSRLTRIPYGDQGFFFHRDCFQELGGFATIPIMEDVEIMRRLKSRGEEIAIIPHPVMTSARRWEREGIIRCTLRNWALIILYICGVQPERLARCYR